MEVFSPEETIRRHAYNQFERNFSPKCGLLGSGQKPEEATSGRLLHLFVNGRPKKRKWRSSK
jgi:hypothetical protein